jgi:hypothetical protein
LNPQKGPALIEKGPFPNLADPRDLIPVMFNKTDLNQQQRLCE